jgi:hypothetical protein
MKRRTDRTVRCHRFTSGPRTGSPRSTAVRPGWRTPTPQLSGPGTVAAPANACPRGLTARGWRTRPHPPCSTALFSAWVATPRPTSRQRNGSGEPFSTPAALRVATPRPTSRQRNLEVRDHGLKALGLVATPRPTSRQRNHQADEITVCEHEVSQHPARHRGHRNDVDVGHRPRGNPRRNTPPDTEGKKRTADVPDALDVDRNVAHPAPTSRASKLVHLEHSLAEDLGGRNTPPDIEGIRTCRRHGTGACRTCLRSRTDTSKPRAQGPG